MKPPCPLLPIEKYGKENFNKQIIEKCDNKELLNEREIFWIKELNSFNPNGYNLHEGGIGGDTFTNNINKELIREKMKIKNKGEKNPNFNKKLIDVWSKKYGIDEANEKIKNLYLKISESVNNSEKYKNAMQNLSDEQRSRIGCNSGISKSEEHKIKISKTLILNETSKGSKNGNFGKGYYKIWIEKYGIDEANKKREIMSIKRKETLKKNKKL